MKLKIIYMKLKKWEEELNKSFKTLNKKIHI